MHAKSFGSVASRQVRGQSDRAGCCRGEHEGCHTARLPRPASEGKCYVSLNLRVCVYLTTKENLEKDEEEILYLNLCIIGVR